MDALATPLSLRGSPRVRTARGCARVVITLLVIATGAHAHAFLDRASPAVGSTLETPPAAITLEFTEDIEISFSTIEVVDADSGHSVAGGAPEHPRPRSLMMALPPLGAGTYEVRWSAMSIDTHRTEGRFKFHIAPR